MSVSTVDFNGDRSSGAKLDSAIQSIETEKIEVTFGGGRVDRAYLEMLINDASEQQQNPALANKWIQIDTALEKELRKFKVAVKALLQTIKNSPPVEQPQAPQQQAQQSQVNTQQGPAEERRLPEPLV